MPIYEFLCQKCKRLFEKFVITSSDNKNVDCPNCGSNDVEKKFSTFSSSCGCGSRETNSSSKSCNITRRFG